MIRVLFFILIPFTLTYAQISREKEYTITYDSASQAIIPVPALHRLIKTGVNLPLYRESSVSVPWKSVGMDIIVEQKVTRDVSVLGGIETNYGFNRNKQLYTIELPIEVRYYFSIGKKMKKRVDPHSMFRYYLAYHTYNALFSSYYYKAPDLAELYYRGNFVGYRTNIGKYNEAFNFLLNAYFQLGYQLKIKSGNYLDVNGVIPITALIYNKQESSLAFPAYVTIKYGLFWGK